MRPSPISQRNGEGDGGGSGEREGGRRIISAAAEEAVGTRAGGGLEMRANRNSSITSDPASITKASGKLSSPSSGRLWRGFCHRQGRE
ncbi:hypothetical protein CEXT_567101 [Caerostris extrusa]|uniref:Uncharacterized protein n=1 Tax=Caerostris extrusa TaxID=172846 RepID=A0AAV4N8Q9_CAEEX|nr:hypothetical protein CEXT_567101 [Caerostris extrusa]